MLSMFSRSLVEYSEERFQRESIDLVNNALVTSLDDNYVTIKHLDTKEVLCCVVHARKKGGMGKLVLTRYGHGIEPFKAVHPTVERLRVPGSVVASSAQGLPCTALACPTLT